MNQYDFSKLNDKEFEVFCTDLIGLREGVRFERFKPGRDEGVDGRYFRSEGDEWILQCKHWVKSPIEKLLKHIEVEAEKVRKLKPTRYFLMVSHELSKNDKSKFLKVLNPFVLSPADIVGREDLNDLLMHFPEVEKKHYKLWLASSNVLNYLYNKPIMDRSCFALQDIMESSQLYIRTCNHDAAASKLDSLGVVILTGSAGVGKTTLAEQLILQYVCEGYSLVSISDDIREAESVLDYDSRQIFYFDDFLGRNYLEALSGHEGAKIVQFIRRIAKNKAKRFVLTSRSTILNQGKILNDVFDHYNINRNEFEIALESLSGMDKAKILYSHIWHSGLDFEFIEQLYEDRRYLDIIMHRSFNPRLIRFITDVQRLKDVKAESYWLYIADLLKNPAKVWENPFEAQTDDCGRALVVLVALNGKLIRQTDLAEAFARYLSGYGSCNLTGKKDFLLNLRHLSGSMLSKVVADSINIYIKLFNPSLRDYVINRYSEDVPALRIYFDSLRARSAVKTLDDMYKNKIISEKAASDVVVYLFEQVRKIGFLGVQAEYVAELFLLKARLGLILQCTDSWVMDVAEFILTSKCEYDFLASTATVICALDGGYADLDKVFRFVLECFDLSPSYDELCQLSELVQYLKRVGDLDLIKDYDKAVSKFLISEVDSGVNEECFFDYGIDQDEVEIRFADFIRDRASELNVTRISTICDEVRAGFDLSGRFSEFLRGFNDANGGDQESKITFSNIIRHENIDDLFSRDF